MMKKYCARCITESEEIEPSISDYICAQIKDIKP